MKEMSKAKIMAKRSVNSVMNEIQVLSQLKHKYVLLNFNLFSFIVNIHFGFQDRENLYLVMDLLLGGDLRYHLSRQRKFNEEKTRKI